MYWLMLNPELASCSNSTHRHPPRPPSHPYPPPRQRHLSYTHLPQTRESGVDSTSSDGASSSTGPSHLGAMNDARRIRTHLHVRAPVATPYPGRSRACVSRAAWAPPARAPSVLLSSAAPPSSPGPRGGRTPPAAPAGPAPGCHGPTSHAVPSLHRSHGPPPVRGRGGLVGSEGAPVRPRTHIERPGRRGPRASAGPSRVHT